jgi:hypothetical protein
MTMINDTTRRFPRTLKEAFPNDDSSWFEEPEEQIGIYDIIFSIISFCIFAGLCYHFYA